MLHAPAIDGVLEPLAWGSIPWTSDFVDIEGGDRPEPEWRTRAKIAWDSDYLYFAAELEEPHLWAEMEDRDSVIWHEDDFEVFIDPDGDQAEYFELELNARNTVFDLFLERTYLNGGPADHDWDVDGLLSAVALDGSLNDPRDRDRGWTVELAWPWSSLKERANRRVPPEPGDTWKINFSRVDWPLEVVEGAYAKRKGIAEHNWVWSPQGVVNMHLPEHWGAVEFAAGIERR